MYCHVGITKEIKEKKKKDVDFEEQVLRLCPVLDDIDINAVSIEPTGYLWGKGKDREYHTGITVEFKTCVPDDELITFYLNMGALVHAINLEFAGAKAVITINGATISYFPGSHSE
jgi:hypothetical protein